MLLQQNATNLRNKVYEDVQQRVAPIRAQATVTMNQIKQRIFEFTKDIDAEIKSYSMLYRFFSNELFCFLNLLFFKFWRKYILFFHFGKRFHCCVDHMFVVPTSQGSSQTGCLSTSGCRISARAIASSRYFKIYVFVSVFVCVNEFTCHLT